MIVLAKAKKFSTALQACEDYVRTGTQSALQARLDKEHAAKSGGNHKKSKEQLAKEALAGFQLSQRKKVHTCTRNGLNLQVFSLASFFRLQAF